MSNDPSAYKAHTDIHRAADGGIDIEHYLRDARRRRAIVLREVVRGLAQCGWRAWGCIKAGLQAQRSAHTLSGMSSRELKDLGLTRSDIESVASGAYFTDPTRPVRDRARRRAA